ncbi:MAG: hypothetical protein K2X27_27080 [Candidatus Obscuribacterales bacterium]|nr:hypothetical protein [Candidatus Obscuribacterales bacterium]
MNVSCFIPSLTAAQASHLDANGCLCTPMQHGNEQGYIVAQHDLPRALQLLNVQVANQAPSRQFEGIIRVELLNGGKPVGAQSFNAAPSGANSLSALTSVLSQVKKLQEQANLTEPERVERLRLQGEVQSKQQVLEAATQRLRSAIQICEQTSARVQSIAVMAAALGEEMKALPEGLQGQCTAVNQTLSGLAQQLEELSASCQGDQTAARKEVAERKAELQSAKDALNADIVKHRLSAEEMLQVADATLQDAEQVVADGQP